MNDKIDIPDVVRRIVGRCLDPTAAGTSMVREKCDQLLDIIRRSGTDTVGNDTRFGGRFLYEPNHLEVALNRIRFDQVRQIDNNGFEFESGPLLYRRVSLSEGKVLGYTGFERGRSIVGAARFAQMIKFRGVGNAAFVDWPEGLSVLYE